MRLLINNTCTPRRGVVELINQTVSRLYDRENNLIFIVLVLSTVENVRASVSTWVVEEGQ